MSESAPNYVKSQYISSSTEGPASLCNGDISIGEGVVLKSTERGRIFAQLKCIVLMEGQADIAGSMKLLLLRPLAHHHLDSGNFLTSYSLILGTFL
eukprot:scaffold19345_cov63-Attheya_sp.AAC.1